jgi:dimethylaniline monooxygenase (N-oxide forming)
MDEIACQIGVKPNLYALFFQDFQLWLKLFFGIWTAHQYRLQGPEPWAEARREIFKINSGYDYTGWKGF